MSDKENLNQSEEQTQSAQPKEEAKILNEPIAPTSDDGPPLFTTNGDEQHPKLKEYLQEKLENPYNKKCFDHSDRDSTHVVVWLGIYVCQECAELHKHSFGGNFNSMVKEIFNEQWDDYQLRSLALGGN